MKTSARTIILTLLLIAAIITGLIYYFKKDDFQIEVKGVESSWAYRKTIYIENSGAMQLNRDVLLDIDTESLITAGKLQLDCDDLRFQDEEDITSLSYWIEGGCNTKNTKIWVRIPSITNPGKNILMFYGNPEAIGVQEKLTISN